MDDHVQANTTVERSGPQTDRSNGSSMRNDAQCHLVEQSVGPVTHPAEKQTTLIAFHSELTITHFSVEDLNVA